LLNLFGISCYLSRETSIYGSGGTLKCMMIIFVLTDFYPGDWSHFMFCTVFVLFRTSHLKFLFSKKICHFKVVLHTKDTIFVSLNFFKKGCSVVKATQRSSNILMRDYREGTKSVTNYRIRDRISCSPQKLS